MTEGNRTPKRLATLLVALAMVLAVGLPTLAENLSEVGISPALPQGGYLKSDLRVEIHANTLFDLLEQHIFDDKTSREGIWEIRGIVEGINKLDATLVQGADLFQLRIGGEDKEPVTVQIALDPEGDKALITSNVLPGIQLSLPKAALLAAFKQAQAQEEQLNVSGAQIRRYAEVFEQYMAGLAQRAAEGSEEGAFEIAGVGQFARKTAFDMDSRSVNELMGQLLAVLKQDTDTQAMLDAYLATAQDVSVKNAADFIAQAEEAIAEELKKENRVLAHHTEYESADGQSRYSETLTASGEDGTPTMQITLLQEADHEDHQDYSHLLVAMLNPGEQPAAAAQAPDWAAVMATVLDGSNKEDVVLSVETYSDKGELDEARENHLHIGLHSPQGYFGVTAIDETAAQGSKGKLSIAALSPDPLFTLHYHSVPVTETLNLGLGENAVTIQAGDAISDEEGNLIAKTLFEEGLPAIIEALPEDVAQFLNIVLEPSEAEVPEEVPAAS